MERLINRINLLGECAEMKLGLWECPPFLFVVMGFITIISMIATYFLASNFIDEPQVAALVVIVITTILLIIGNVIIAGFRRIAEASKMQAEFISIASHQLRSPLSIIKWSAEAAKRESAKTDIVKQQEFFDTTERTVGYMIRLVNSLLEVSRIESSTFTLRKDEFSLVELTKEILKEFENFAYASNMHIAFTPPENVPNIIGDRERTEITIQNLVDNAIQYSKGPNKIVITIEIPSRNYVLFRIHDNGVGIPADQQSRVFTKFFRASNGRKIQAAGTGIGLYIVKKFITAMGGKINFSSEVGKGTTFWFTLPIAK